MFAPDSTPRSSSRWLRVALVGTLAVLVVAAIRFANGIESGGGRESADAPPAAGAHSQSTTTRTLLVSRRAMPEPSRPGAALNALRVAGVMPSGPDVGTVLTDEQCEPDAEGVSHCLNRLRLTDGRTLTVRHPHRMSEVPCMVPGETVRVRPA
mgnify:CR=1 FL=1